MKIEVEILESQLDLLEKIRSLPKVIKNHVGELPHSWPGVMHGSEIDQIKELCEALEFKWKKWFFSTICLNAHIKDLLKGTCLSEEYNYIEPNDLI